MVVMDYIKYKDAGKILGLSGKRIEQLSKQGKIKHGPKIGRANTVDYLSLLCYKRSLNAKRIRTTDEIYMNSTRFDLFLDNGLVDTMKNLGITELDIQYFAYALVRKVMKKINTKEELIKYILE